MNGMIEIHYHLPRVDDGANSWGVTLEMCRLAHQDGATHIYRSLRAQSSDFKESWLIDRI